MTANGMPLLSGTRLGPYEIIAPLGAGGMGEVYKARHTRLHREVAIKVLPANRVSDPDRKARFIQEARAASSLNHPNIVTIHDIAEADGADFLVMELVSGKTLEQLIGRKGLALGEVLRHAITLADALTKAHAAGIIHRDLKPSNIMISDDGALKVLDFGLAKLTERRGGADDSTATIEGTIAGTIAYMSPEQAEGKPVDARSDIFSFGCVLYEMVTGRRAFTGDTQASTLAAVLREEPKLVSGLVEGTPRDLERIIQRCMRKDPARRFQHMGDVKVELAEVKEESDSATGVLLTPAIARPRRRRALWVAAGALALFAGAAAWLRFRPEPAEQLVSVPLVAEQGNADGPTFSPDGSQVAYSWNGEKQDNNDIYVSLIGSGKPLRLTTDPAADTAPAWSPDGRSIAFIRRGRGVYLVSPLGGGEHKVAEGSFPRLGPGGLPVLSGLSWSPDSKLLAAASDEPGAASIVTIRIDDGQRHRLTTPPANKEDSHPAISPDGRRMVFVRCSFLCQLYLLELTADYHAAGEPKALMPEGSGVGVPVWTSDGREILYVLGAQGVGVDYLMRMRPEPGARPERLAFAGDRVVGAAISARGNRLAYTVDLSDVDIRVIQPGGTAHSLISSTRTEMSPQFSPDGTRIAFSSDRTGVMEIWTCDQDGSNPTQLTHFRDRPSGTPSWSPDGRTIAFDSRLKEGWRVFRMGSDSGQTRRLTQDDATELAPSWSADGKTIYFASDRTGRFEIWQLPAGGGKATQVTKNGGFVAFESRDGRRLYYTKSDAESPIWMQPVEGGAEKLLIESVVSRAFVVEEDGIYYVPRGMRGAGSLQFYRFATGLSEPVAALQGQGRIHLGLSVSSDRKTFLYAGNARTGRNLMLVDGFK